MFKLFGRKKTPRAARKPIIRNQARYQIVSSPDQYNRPLGHTETVGEDEVLSGYKRGRLLDLARNAARNSSTLNTLLTTLCQNVVGTTGGKVILPWDADKLILRPFARFTQNADFFDGISFNEVLRLILTTNILGGNTVAIYDNGLVTDSGKLLIFEPDELGNTTEDALRYHYGPSAHQSQGLVYDSYGRNIGCIVSRACRGAETFDPSKCWFLHRNPDKLAWENDYFLFANRFRPHQGRGVSSLANVLGTILDLEMLQGFELQGSKRNAQLLLQILQPTEKDEEVAEPSAFGDDEDIQNLSEEEIERLAAQETEEVKTQRLDKFNTAAAEYQVMPPGVKAELLESKRPNPNVQQFIDWLAGRSFSPFGLSRMFATGDVKSADFKSNQLYSERSFQQHQKQLEAFCDFTFRKWSGWASKRKIIKPLSEEQLESIAWDWPKQSALDEESNQRAIKMQLENLTKSYRDILGNDYQSKLAAIKDELAWCKANGIPHPAFKLLSGGESAMISKDDNGGE